MTDFNPAAGGAALVLAAAIFIAVGASYVTWATIIQYGWIEALRIWGGIVGTVLVIVAIFLVGGSIE